VQSAFFAAAAAPIAAMRVRAFARAASSALGGGAGARRAASAVAAVPPPADFAKLARVKSAAHYAEVHAASLAQPAAFWAAEAETLKWKRRWDTVDECALHARAAPRKVAPRHQPPPPPSHPLTPGAT